MERVVQGVLLGVGIGGVHAVLGQSVALVQRASGVLHLAHGAYALAAAFLFRALTDDIATGPALAATVAFTAVLGAATELLVLRWARHRAPLVQLAATLGVLVVGHAAVGLAADPGSSAPASLLPQEPVDLLGTTVGRDRLLVGAVAVAVTGALWVIARRTRAGLAATTMADDPRAVAALGWSPERVALGSAAAGAALAGLAGVLAAPLVGLDPAALAVLVVPAVAAALGGRSFPVVAACGLGIGVAQQLADRHVGIDGAGAAVPYLALVAVLAVGRAPSTRRPAAAPRPLPPAVVGAARWRPVVAATAAAAVLIAVAGDAWTVPVATSLVAATVLLSVVVVTGLGGHVSLAQLGFAGLGGATTAWLVDAGWPFEPAALAALALTVPVAVGLALPAARSRGPGLAVATLGAAVALHALVLDGTPARAGHPRILGIDVDALAHPRRFALAALVLFVGCALGVVRLARGPSGRRLLAARSSARAAASLGIDVRAVRLRAVATGAAMASGAGSLLAYLPPAGTLEAATAPLPSVLAVALAFLGGIGSVLGPLVGASLVAGGVGTEFLGGGEDAQHVLALAGGLGLLLVLATAPDGLVPLARRVAGRPAPAPEAPPVDLRRPEPRRVRPATLTVDGLVVRVGGIVAVDDVRFEVGPGEIVGLVGPNGAGTTAVLDAVTGFRRAERGTVQLGGEHLDGRRPHQRARAGVARSFSDPALVDDLTVWDNLRLDGDEPTPAALAAIRALGLDAELGARPGDLAADRRRLVSVARAVGVEPSVLLLDEPGLGLGDVERAALIGLVRHLARDWGMAVVLVEHDLELALEACDRMVVLDRGAVVAAGAPSAIRHDRAAVAAYLGEDIDELLEDAST